MSGTDQITQRDLRLRSKDIMDSVERGETFTVTRHGREIGVLMPLARRRRFVSRETFAAGSRVTPGVDPATLRADQDEYLDDVVSDPYVR